MLTGHARVAAVGVFVATVSVLGLCFKVWPGDYQLNESKSANMTQPYELQPAMHLQLDENEKASMRKIVLDLHGAIPEALVKLNSLLENVTPPTSKILLTQNEKEVMGVTLGDNTYTFSGTVCAPENAITTAEECKTAATAMDLCTNGRCTRGEGRSGMEIYNQRNIPGCSAMGDIKFNTYRGAEASCTDGSGGYGDEGRLCICRGTAALQCKKLDKAHRICLNTRLNELDATYETSLVDYKAKKGDHFVEGPVTQWSTAYANADADQSLADEDFLKVATAKANFDYLFFYLKTSHTIEICCFTAEDANTEAVKANPVLFNLPESQCAKAISAVDDFETGAGKDLLSKCNEVVTEAPTDQGAE